MNNSSYTEVDISSLTLTPDEMNSILGMKYDHYHIKGNSRSKTTIKATYHRWIIYSRISRELPIEAHVEDLLARIIPIRDTIKKISKHSDVNVSFGCVIHTKDRMEFIFTNEQISIINDLGASIDIDLYLLPDEDDI